VSETRLLLLLLLLKMTAERHNERRLLSRRLASLQQSYQRLSETAATLRCRKRVCRIFTYLYW